MTEADYVIDSATPPTLRTLSAIYESHGRPAWAAAARSWWLLVLAGAIGGSGVFAAVLALLLALEDWLTTGRLPSVAVAVPAVAVFVVMVVVVAAITDRAEQTYRSALESLDEKL